MTNPAKNYCFIISLFFIFSLTLSCKKAKRDSIPGADGYVKYFAGVNTNTAVEVFETADGGYVLAGSSASEGVVSSLGNNTTDMFILKTDKAGNEQWHKLFGGSYFDECGSMCLTPDGGYLLLGTYSYKKLFANADSQTDSTDMYAVKVDQSGNKVWERKYSYCSYSNYCDSTVDVGEQGISVVQTDEGYMMAGMVSRNHQWDTYQTLVDFAGNEITNYHCSYGVNNKDDNLINVIKDETNTGSYFLSSSSTISDTKTPAIWGDRKNGGTLTLFEAPSSFDWSESPEVAYAGEIKYSSAGYVLVGTTIDGDIYVLKFDLTSFNKISKWKYGSANYAEQGLLIAATSDGGYILGGTTNDPNIIGKTGNQEDIYVIKIDASGNKTWEKTFGKEGFDTIGSIKQTSEGGYILCGTIDVGNNGAGSSLSKRIALIKLDQNGNSIAFQ